MAKFRISGVPITEGNGKLVGIITNRDLKFENRLFSRPIHECMTSEESGHCTGRRLHSKEAKAILAKARVGEASDR